jgi:hypothetical protein
MSENLGYIDDFIMIETILNKDCYETSLYTGISDFFFSHLKEKDISEKINIQPINVFELKQNDRLKLNPSKWTLDFIEKHKLEKDFNEYNKIYLVKDIVIRYYSSNPNSDSNFPRIDIKIILDEIE